MKIKKDPKCEDGYFLPNDNKSVCHSCQLSNCKSCTGTKESQKCTSCMNDYMPIYGNDGFIINCTNIYNTSTDNESYTDEPSDLNSETDLDTGNKSESKTDLDTGNKSGEETDINTIKKSDSETDLDTGKNLDSETNLDTGNKSDLETNLVKCPIENCEECGETKDSINCVKCAPFHELYKGECIPNYTIKATYKPIHSDDQIQLYYQKNIIQKIVLIENGEFIETLNNLHTFNNDKENTVYIYIKKTATFFSSTFKNCDRLVKVYIPPNALNENKITSFFQCLKIAKI